MTLLAPLWMYVGAAAAAAVTLLHFFARRRPRPAPLPTARFVPDISARAPAPARRPTDLMLLVLRVLALLGVALALARPEPAADHRPVARIVALVGGDAAARDSARALAGDGDTLIEARSVSAALTAAIRASAALKRRADSIELAIVSPFTTATVDAATDSLRALWPGRVRLVTLTAADPAPPRRLEVIAGQDDPLRATAALLGARAGPLTRVLRAAAGPSDSAFARAGGVLVVWPRDPASLWPRVATDTIGGVAAEDVVVVATFVRGATLARQAAARRLSSWADGEVAADEQPLGAGCLRRVAIAVPEVGDLPLRSSMVALLDRLTGDCGAPPGGRLTDERLARLAGSGPLLAARLAPEARRGAAPLSAWLLAASALLLLLEPALRPRMPS